MAIKFPEDQTGYPGFIRFTPVDDKGAPLDAQDGEIIELYLPAGVLFADKMEYENMALGLAGVIGADDENTATAENIFSGDVAGLALQEIVKKAVSGAAGAIQQRNKISPNPNTRALFKQVSLRSFQFNFKLIPTTETEATTITNIVKEFRTQMYPNLIGGGGEGTSVGYEFPNRYQIETFYDGQADMAPKIFPAYLEAFQASYNPTGQTIFQKAGGQGYFAETDMNLTFTESRALTKQDIAGGY